MQVSNHSCVVTQIANPVTWFIYVFIVTARNLIEVVRWYFDNFEPTWSRVKHCHAYETNIIINDRAELLLLSYRLTIWLYQVHMHQTPRFYFYNVISW